jgi:adenylate cyclase
MTGAYNALACTTYCLGDFEKARHYATRGAQIWRSAIVQSPVQEVDAPVVSCLFHKSLSEWHLQEITSCHQAMAEAILLAKELNDMGALANAIYNSGVLAHFERDVSQAERSTSGVIELSTRHNLPFWLTIGSILRGWVRSVSGETVEGMSCIEQGIEDYRAPGSMLGLPFFLALKSEALFVANRTSEALEAVEEAEAVAERFEVRWWCAELHRLRGVFLAALGAGETQIEAAFCEGIRIAKEQKSISLARRAEATYAEYHRQKASALGGNEVRLPLC